MASKPKAKPHQPITSIAETTPPQPQPQTHAQIEAAPPPPHRRPITRTHATTTSSPGHTPSASAPVPQPQPPPMMSAQTEMITTLTNVIKTVQNDNADTVISNVHECAAAQYRQVKKRKQDELRPKIHHAERLGDRAIVKNQKKKVDNHASAVASRVKQDFLIRQFDALVREKMEFNVHMAGAILSLSAALDSREEQVTTLAKCNAVLSKQIADAGLVPKANCPPDGELPTHSGVQKASATTPAADVVSSLPVIAVETGVQTPVECAQQDGGRMDAWSTFGMEDINQFDSGLASDDTPSEGSETLCQDVPPQSLATPLENAGVGNEETAKDHALELLLEKVNQAHMENTLGHKLDPFSWEPLQSSVIFNRQMSVRAQLLADQQLDDDDFYINPVA